MSAFRTIDDDLSPTNAKLVTPLLTDMYQISMTYAHWKGGRVNDHAVFDLFFRKCPFKGEFALFCGLEEVLRFCHSFRFSESDIVYLKKLMPAADPEFFVWLSQLTCSEVKLYSHKEGSIVFPREPLIRVEGPLGITQLLETTLLTLVNFPSLIATNAARMRIAAGAKAECLEFGLRRAQGPDGGISASRYAIMGGFHGTSNVAAGSLFGMDVKGTHAHAYVMSYTGLKDLRTRRLQPAGGGEEVDFVALVLSKRSQLYGGHCTSSDSEMAAFISFAQAFPDGVLALVDTYDTLSSGVPNFIAVALALRDAGFSARGVRLDSGDLAYLSRETRAMLKCGCGALASTHPAATAHSRPCTPHPSTTPRFPPPFHLRRADEKYGSSLASVTIVASNDLNEGVLLSLAKQGHSIDAFGVGTNLVTCQAQPALGMVFKLVELSGEPRIKISQDSAKITIPGQKEVFRLLGSEGVPLLDIMIRAGEARPKAGKRLLAHHPFDEKKRVYVTPAFVIPLLRLVWLGKRAAVPDDLDAAELAAIAAAGGGGGGARAHHLRARSPPLDELRAFTAAQVKLVREDHLRPLNPTPYKVSVSTELFQFIRELLLRDIPIAEIS